MTADNILQLLAVIVIFVIILFATYYVTKWIAKSGVMQSRAKNIKVIETFKIAPNKYIQIIRLGSKYCAIGISKENISFLVDLEEGQLDLSGMSNQEQQASFQELLQRFGRNRKK